MLVPGRRYGGDQDHSKAPIPQKSLSARASNGFGLGCSLLRVSRQARIIRDSAYGIRGVYNIPVSETAVKTTNTYKYCGNVL